MTALPTPSLEVRVYDPTTGQFLTRDPIEAITRSAYGYVNGNLLNATDPSGLFRIPGTDWCVDIADPNCESIAEQHPEAAQTAANVAGGTLDGLTLGNGRNVLNLTTNSGGQVRWDSPEAMGGRLIGTALLVPFAISGAPVAAGSSLTVSGAFTYASYAAAAGSLYSNCANGPGGFWSANCAKHTALAIGFVGYSGLFGAFDGQFGNMMTLIDMPWQSLFDLVIDGSDQC